MRCIEDNKPVAAPGWRATVVLMTAVLAACQSSPPTSSVPPTPEAPVVTTPAPAAVAPASAKNWNEFKVYAARRVVAANPTITHLGVVQQPALAIPVLEIELNADGSVRRIDVMRYPSQAKEMTQVAIDAVRKAGSFGSVAHLPKPWKFSETFLFNHDRRFKPASLDR